MKNGYKKEKKKKKIFTFYFHHLHITIFMLWSFSFLILKNIYLKNGDTIHICKNTYVCL